MLAAYLNPYANQSNVLVLALPRGGVAVAFEVAQLLRAPMDVLLVRKLGVPHYKEFAMGAIASGGIRVLNQNIVRALHIPNEAIESVTAEEERELRRREKTYRGHRASLKIRDKTIILVDDGISTGSTVQAALEALKERQPRRVVMATPVASSSSCAQCRSLVDEMVVLATPAECHDIGNAYQDFAPVFDSEVIRLMESARVTHVPVDIGIGTLALRPAVTWSTSFFPEMRGNVGNRGRA